jgi:hypothetical protein
LGDVVAESSLGGGSVGVVVGAEIAEAGGRVVTMPDIVAYGSGGGGADSVGARIRRTMTSILDPGAAA